MYLNDYGFGCECFSLYISYKVSKNQHFMTWLHVSSKENLFCFLYHFLWCVYIFFMIKPKNNNASYMFSHKSYYYICINDYSTFIFSSSFLIFFCLQFFFFFIYFRTININTMIYFTMIIIKLRKYVFYICSVIIIALSVTFSFFFINLGIFFLL